VLVLLPPSEGKAPSGRGAPLKPEALSLPGLGAARETVLDALVALCSGDEEKAREVLKLSEGQRGEVARNTALRTAGTRTAGTLYTGVLYDALDLATLDAAAKRRAARSLLVFSGLWGAVRVTDRIPSYRCSMGVSLPGVGGLASFWRPAMARVLPEAAGDGLVLDLRSSAYAAAWKPQGRVAERTATVRVLHARVVDGVERRSVVSHFNKATKGRLLRALLASGAAPRTPEELVDALRQLGFAPEVAVAGGAGRPWGLDVVVTDLN
jgi:uncharacterized protein